MWYNEYKDIFIIIRNANLTVCETKIFKGDIMKTTNNTTAEFAQCYAELKKEGIFKSIAVAVIIGCSIGFTIALCMWFVSTVGFWITLAVTFAVIVGLSIALYFTAYRPDDYKIARKLDRAGMDERMITMLEFRDSDSYMAIRQREDAFSTFDSARKKGEKNLVRSHLSLAAVVIIPVVATLFLGMITISGLCAFGIIPKGSELWNKAFSKQNIYVVTYEGSDGGSVYGETEQQVAQGASTSRVVAVADDGYMFDKWVDNDGNEFYGEPSRFENNVKRDIKLTAMFVEVEDSEDDPEGKFNFEQPEGGNSSGSNNGSGNGPGGGDPTDQNDFIIDGNTDYKEHYDDYYNDAMSDLSSGDSDNIPPELREILEGYFEILK